MNVKTMHKRAMYRRVEEPRRKRVTDPKTNETETVNYTVTRLRPRKDGPSLKAFARERGIAKRRGAWVRG